MEYERVWRKKREKRNIKYNIKNKKLFCLKVFKKTQKKSQF